MAKDNSDSDSEKKIREAAKRAAEKVDTEELPPGCPMPLDEAIRRVLKAPTMPAKESTNDND